MFIIDIIVIITSCANGFMQAVSLKGGNFAKKMTEIFLLFEIEIALLTLHDETYPYI